VRRDVGPLLHARVHPVVDFLAQLLLRARVHDQFAQTAINTIFALCGSTLVTFVLSAALRRGKVAIGDIANAALAGGVSIGATCNVVTGPQALLIGALAGAICTVGFVIVQPMLLKRFKILDSAGVHNLHGMPGMFGAWQRWSQSRWLQRLN